MQPFLLLRAFLLSVFIFAGVAQAAEPSAKENIRDPLNPFRRNYLNLEIGRNFPISLSKDRFEPSWPQPTLGFRHNLSRSWMMGLSWQFKAFKKKNALVETEQTQSDRVVFWTLTHETLYIVRLYHPTYLFVGPKIHYLLPTQAAKLPIVRDTDYGTEVGGALSISLAHLVSERLMLTFGVDRWRGTGTRKFQGTDVLFGFGYGWD